MRIVTLALLIGCLIAAPGIRAAEDAESDEAGWVSLFDGQSMEGWKCGENIETWSVKDGALVCHGKRSHLFYVGDDKPFVNFEFQADVMTTTGSNSGIYFHTRYQAEGWPENGFESQVNVTHRDHIKTASLYGLITLRETPAKDDQWWTQTIIVQGRSVVVKVDDQIVIEYTEQGAGKPDPNSPGKNKLSAGTFALQGHDPKSIVYFKNIRVKRLP